MPVYWPLLVAIGIMILGGFLAFKIDWAGIIYNIYKDKPNCGYMEVFNGKGYDPVPGRRVSIDVFGEIFEYQYLKRWYEVRIGANYPRRFINRGRLIRCRPNSLIALSLGTDEQNPLEPQFTEQEIGLQTYGWALVELNKSIRGKAVGIWMIWLIVGAVLIVVIGAGIFIWNKNQQKTAAPPATPAPTQQAPGGPVKPLPSAEAFNQLVEVF